MEKFYEGTTTQTQERLTSNNMEFPQFMICSKFGYKADALTELGLPKNFLSTMEPRRVVNDNHDFDVQNVWDVGTYSYADLFINWMVTHSRKHHSFNLNEEYN